MLHLLCRHCSLPHVQTLVLTSCADYCSLPPMQTAAPYLLCRPLLLTSCADCCSLPPVQTAVPYLLRRLRHCYLPHKETLHHLPRRHCSVPPEETLLLLLRRHCSIVIASGPEVLVAPEVGAAAVASPAKRRELDTYSSSKADLSENSLPPVSIAPMVSPFLCSDDSESDTEIPERHVSPAPHDAMLTRALTAEKSVRPLPSYRLALRYTSDHLDRFTSGSSSNHSPLHHSSSRHSTSDQSSSGHSTSSHSLSGHTSPVTTIADSSTPSRFVYPLLIRTSWSTAATVTSSIPASRALVPSRADLLPPRKRFRDSISPEDSVEEDINADVLADIEAGATTVVVAADIDVRAGVDAGIGMEVNVGFDVGDEVEGEVESNDRVAEALAAYEANRAAKLAVESQSHNGDDDDNGNVRGNGNENDGGNGDGNGRGNGNGNGGGNGNGNPNPYDKGTMPVARECTYHDFMKCQPLNFKGTEGVVGLTRWFEKMETIFHISNYPDRYQVKYATRTLLNSALTWWNAHKITIRADAAFSMSWRELMKLMTEVYCPRNEIQKMETELWNLTMKGNDLAAYTQRFQELSMLCTKMVPKEEDQIEKFIGGLPDNIRGTVIAAEPTRL
ncbi:reverse transcriptase domain-containing protein [Tanacetum coccineum]